MEGAPSRCQFSWSVSRKMVIGGDSKEWVFALSGWGGGGGWGDGRGE